MVHIISFNDFTVSAGIKRGLYWCSGGSYQLCSAGVCADKVVIVKRCAQQNRPPCTFCNWVVCVSSDPVLAAARAGRGGGPGEDGGPGADRPGVRPAAQHSVPRGGSGLQQRRHRAGLTAHHHHHPETTYAFSPFSQPGFPAGGPVSSSFHITPL